MGLVKTEDAEAGGLDEQCERPGKAADAQAGGLCIKHCQHITTRLSFVRDWQQE